MRAAWGRTVVAAAVTLCALTACQSGPQGSSENSVRADTGGMNELTVQALVMEMADEYIIALSEAVYLHLHYEQEDSRSRWLSQSFLRNGVGAALDIASGANPDVALLDLLVLASVQSWAFEDRWINEMTNSGERERKALARIREGEAKLWEMSRRVLEPAQEQELRALIEEWKSHNAERTVVALVRFDEMMDERRLPNLASRDRASGLFRAVSEATSEIEQSRLLGERLLWTASRYPYLLGQQSELTAYRLADQPEMRAAAEAIEAVQGLAAKTEQRMESLDRDVADQITAAFDLLSEERTAAIEQAEESMTNVLLRGLDDLERRVRIERLAAIDGTFDRFRDEWRASLDDLQEREPVLRDMLVELRDTIESSGELAVDLTGTVEALDRLAARFDERDAGDREPLDMKDVRDAAIETAKAAERLTELLEHANTLVDSGKLSQPAESLERASAGAIDRAFYRGLILVGVLVAGMIVSRLIPQRQRAG